MNYMKIPKPIIATLFLDNYDEITQNMNDTQRSESIQW